MTTEHKPQTGTLAEFLLARIAEDEAVAREPMMMWPSSYTPEFLSFHLLPEGSTDRARGEYHYRFRPDRVLAESEAKRRIVERFKWSLEVPDGYLPVGQDARRTLRDLALPYADHPDYREEWKP